MVVRHDGKLYPSFTSNTARRETSAGSQAKLRNLESGSMSDFRFSSEDMVERAFLDEKEVEFLYPEGDLYTFMDTTTFEQYHLTRDELGDSVGYLIPNLQLKIEFFEGKPIGVELPATIDLKVVETEPGIKGASATNVMKPAKLETGITVLVPPFISEGEKIRVNTSDGTYQERAK
jgi:elongation factor P